MDMPLGKNDEELIKGMEEYILRLQENIEEDARQEAIRALIRTGVLDENGNTKESIVTGY